MGRVMELCVVAIKYFELGILSFGGFSIFIIGWKCGQICKCSLSPYTSNDLNDEILVRVGNKVTNGYYQVSCVRCEA